MSKLDKFINWLCLGHNEDDPEPFEVGISSVGSDYHADEHCENCENCDVCRKDD